MVVRTAVGPAPVAEDLALPEDDGALSTLVGRDVKGETTEAERALLRRPGTLQRWHNTLVALDKELQAQFTERRAAADLKQQECLRRGPKGKVEWFDYRAQYNAWRAGANRFKSKVEVTLSECKRTMREKQSYRSPHSTGERRLYRQTLRSVRNFLVNEATVTAAHQGARWDLLQRVDEVLFDQVRLLAQEGGEG